MRHNISAQIEKHPAEQYARKAADGKLVCSKWVKLAAQRHLDDLKHGHERGLHFDPAAAQHVLDFFHVLRHSKGEWVNKPVMLEPWQQFKFWCVFGWKREDGFRRFRTAHCEVARGNGKSTESAGVGLYGLSADDEGGAEVYCFATKKDQAKIVFDEAVRMRDASPALAKRIAKFRNNLHITGTASKFQPLGADSKTQDGLRTHFGIADELHAQKSRALYDVIDTSTGTRRQPLLWGITTAGSDFETICGKQHDYAERVLDGYVQDDTFFAYLACLDLTDDWQDERNWIKPNPNLGVCVKIDDLRRKAAKAKEDPSALNAFLRLHMNLWTSSVTAAISPEDWKACVGYALQGTDPLALRRMVEAELAAEHRRCVIAVDLASTDDLVAELKVFPPEEENGNYIALADFWMAKDNIERKKKEWRQPYDVWEREGWIRVTENNVVDQAPIREQILKDFERFDVTEMTFDPWNGTQFSNDLQAAGIEVDRLVKFTQSIANFAEPTKKLLSELIPARRIAHLANPVLAWHARNLMVWSDGNGNRRPSKKSSRAKIDGMVALIMGIGRLIATPDDGGERYTEERGVLVV